MIGEHKHIKLIDKNKELREAIAKAIEVYGNQPLLINISNIHLELEELIME